MNDEPMTTKVLERMIGRLAEITGRDLYLHHAECYRLPWRVEEVRPRSTDWIVPAGRTMQELADNIHLYLSGWMDAVGKLKYGE